MIIGIAGDYEEALELTRRIIDDTYTNTGKVDVYNIAITATSIDFTLS